MTRINKKGPFKDHHFADLETDCLTQVIRLAQQIKPKICTKKYWMKRVEDEKDMKNKTITITTKQ